MAIELNSEHWLLRRTATPVKRNTQELNLEKRCRAYARQHGWVCCKLEKNGNKGIPDDLFISPTERCILIEFKKDEKQKPRPEQAIWLQRFPQIAFLVGSFDEFLRVTNLPPEGEDLEK